MHACVAYVLMFTCSSISSTENTAVSTPLSLMLRMGACEDTHRHTHTRTEHAPRHALHESRRQTSLASYTACHALQGYVMTYLAC